MNLHKRALLASCLLLVLFVPQFGRADEATESASGPTDICHVAMSRTALRIKFDKERKFSFVLPGAPLAETGEIENHTAIPMHHVRLILRVLRTRFDDQMRELPAQPGDVAIIEPLSDEYDIAPNTSTPFVIHWNVPASTGAAFLRIEAYPVQNGVHVLGDYLNTEYHPRDYTFAQVTGSAKNSSSVHFSRSGVVLDGKPYTEVADMPVLEPGDPGVVEIPVVNDSPKNQTVSVGWRTFVYGPLSENDLFSSSTIFIQVPAHQSAVAKVDLPDIPAIRYAAIAEITASNTRMLYPMRVGRNVPATPDVDMYGVAEDILPDATSTGPSIFALQHGKTYHAFACIVGSIVPATTTVALKLTDEHGREIPIHDPETRLVGPVIESFIYDFTPDHNVSSMHLHITATVNGAHVGRDWSTSLPASETVSDGSGPEGNLKQVSRFWVIAIVGFGVIAGLYIMARLRNFIHLEHHEK